MSKFQEVLDALDGKQVFSKWKMLKCEFLHGTKYLETDVDRHLVYCSKCKLPLYNANGYTGYLKRFN